MRLGHHFQGQMVKGQGHQAALLSAVLARQAAAAVGARTCWPWETAATLLSARRWKALRRPRGEERGGGIPWRPPAYSLFCMRQVRHHELSEVPRAWRSELRVQIHASWRLDRRQLDHQRKDDFLAEPDLSVQRISCPVFLQRTLSARTR